jgi:hypothetical protein
MAMAGDEQQAMTSERLAEIQAWATQSPSSMGIGYAQAAVIAVELIDEVERRRAREAALAAIARAVAEAIRYEVATARVADMDKSIVGHGYMACVSPTIQEQARALLAEDHAILSPESEAKPDADL